MSSLPSTGMSSLPSTCVEGFHELESLQKMTYRRLGETDMTVSSLSLGSSSFGGEFEETDDCQSEDLVVRVLRQGVNYIDTAPWYGQGRAETVLGRALKNVPREAFYIATKVGRYNKEVENMFDFTANRVRRSVMASLERLGVEYIDLIQVHDVEFCLSLEQLVKHTLPALYRLKEEGRVRYVGITGYGLGTLQRLVSMLQPSCPVDTVLSYCRATLHDQTLLGAALSFFSSHKVGVINASPVAMGLLSTSGPPTWHPAPPSIKAVCAQAAGYSRSQGQDITDLAILWCLGQGGLATTLVSTASRDFTERNLELARLGKLSKVQEGVVRELKETFFRYLPSTNWENLEVAEYWTKMESLGASQPSDL